MPFYPGLLDESDSKKRFVTSFNGAGDVKFGPKESCPRRNYDSGRSVVDYSQQGALEKRGPIHLLNMVLFDEALNVVYRGPAFRSVKEAAPPVPVKKAIPKSVKIFDGSWRKVPEFIFGTSGWVFSYAMMFQNRPLSWTLGPFKTQEELFAEMFDEKDEFLQSDAGKFFLQSLPLAAPEPDAQPAAPVTRSYTTQEIEEIEKNTPAAELQLRYLSDPGFRAAYDALENHRTAIQAKFAEKAARERELAASDAARRRLGQEARR